MNRTKKVLLLAVLAIAPSLNARGGSGWGWGLGALGATALIASAANRDRYVYADPYYDPYYAGPNYARGEVFYSRNGNPYTLDRWGNRVYLRTARPVYRDYRREYRDGDRRNRQDRQYRNEGQDKSQKVANQDQEQALS